MPAPPPASPRLRVRDVRELWEIRFALQRLTGTPAPDPVSAVRESLAVQSQDVPLAHDSLAQRTRATAAEATAALHAGRVVRTHVLRPTWHHVAAEDVRWLLALTSPKVLSGMAARHRRLGLAEPADRTPRLDFLLAQVAEGPRTRAELGAAFVGAGVLDRSHPEFWAQVSHVCLIAELEGLVCSGPVDPAGLNGHTYVLADSVLPPAAPRPRAEAVTELVGRFFASHGPVAVADLQRWTRLTRTEIAAAIGELGDGVTRVVVDDVELWAGTRALDERRPSARSSGPTGETGAAGAWLLSTFDEAVLTHSVLPLPGAADSVAKYGESGGGPAIWDLRRVGAWKRTERPGRFRVEVRPDRPLSRGAEPAFRAAADALARRAGHDAAEFAVAA